MNLMAPAKINKIKYIFINNQNYFFFTTEFICQFAGFLKVNSINFSNYNIKLVSILKSIDNLIIEKIESKEYQEGKPIRYNEGTLVQKLEKLGIGRPSTYSAFGNILIKRNYVILNNKGQFVLQQLGYRVNQ